MRIRQTGSGHVVPGAVKRRYVALRNIRLGGRLVKAGAEVKLEPGRNAASMIRHGDIGQVIEPSEEPSKPTTRKRGRS